MDFLEGKKTLIGAVLYGISATLYSLKKINEDQKMYVDAIAESIMIYGFYHMVKRNTSK